MRTASVKCAYGGGFTPAINLKYIAAAPIIGAAAVYFELVANLYFPLGLVTINAFTRWQSVSYSGLFRRASNSFPRNAS